jgi:hypothetical protein
MPVYFNFQPKKGGLHASGDFRLLYRGGPVKDIVYCAMRKFVRIVDKGVYINKWFGDHY